MLKKCLFACFTDVYTDRLVWPLRRHHWKRLILISSPVHCPCALINWCELLSISFFQLPCTNIIIHWSSTRLIHCRSICIASFDINFSVSLVHVQVLVLFLYNEVVIHQHSTITLHSQAMRANHNHQLSTLLTRLAAADTIDFICWQTANRWPCRPSWRTDAAFLGHHHRHRRRSDTQSTQSAKSNVKR